MKKWIIDVGIALGIAFGAALILFGFFFFIVGAWGAFFAYGGLYGLSYLVMLFGGSMLAVGIIVVLKLVEARAQKWITLVRMVSSATLIVVGLSFFSLSFVLSTRIGGMLNPLTLFFVGLGGSSIAAGIIVISNLLEAWKPRLFSTVKIISSAILFSIGLIFIISGGLLVDLLLVMIGIPIIIAGGITLLRTVRR